MQTKTFPQPKVQKRDRKALILNVIARYLKEKGYAPSVFDLHVVTGIPQPSLWRYLNQLVESGHLQRPRPNVLTLTDKRYYPSHPEDV